MENYKNLLVLPPNMSKKWNPLIPYPHELLLNPETLKAAVLNSDRIRELCVQMTASGEKVNAKTKKAIKYILQEIGLAYSLPTIRTLGICLNKILDGMISGVYVNQTSIKTLKQVLSTGKSPVIYLPSHRSYADFILMSYICFAHDIEIPAIAAGIDFHAMIGMGTLLRSTGAFFMRRSYSNDSLYWNVFKEYVRLLMTKYHTGLEFFIEGTRSRSNKALAPKMGLLSMALEPFFDRDIFDVTIVPVGVAYDKPIEEVLFAYELLGVPKPKETTMGFLKALQILEVDHGKMFVNFGQPISLKESLLKNRNLTNPEQLLNNASVLKENRNNIIHSLAYEVVDKQQQLIVISLINLISTYFNYRRFVKQDTRTDSVVRGVQLLVTFLKSIGASVATMDNEDLKTSINEALRIHNNVLQQSRTKGDLLELVRPAVNSFNAIRSFKGHKLSANTMFNAVPSLLLQLYSNPCLYWWHIPAFYILAKYLTSDRDRQIGEVRELQKLFSIEFISDNQCDDQKNAKALDELSKFATSELNDVILSSIGPYLCCYLNVAEVLLTMLAPFCEKDLHTKVQAWVEHKIHNSMFQFIHPVCLSLDSISNALNSFVLNNYVIKNAARANGKTQYSANRDNVENLQQYLAKYCNILGKFDFFSDYCLPAKL